MPALLKQIKFEFVSEALPEDAFGVVNFKGSEGFSTCYQFEIMLVAGDPEINLAVVLQNPAVFTILRDDGNIPFHGILSQFEQLHCVDEFVFYQAVLVPRLWWLSLTHHNQIFLDKTVPQIIEVVLQDGGLTSLDFELRLENKSKYPIWEYICQYRESHLDFVSRWMEREGMYYYFEQTADGEKMIITDTNLSHTTMAEGRTMYYSPPTGLDERHREEVIHALICKQKLLPGKLHVQDYNYRTPSVNLSAEAPVSDQGRGEVHIYGEHFRTLQEGSGLAGIRVQELQSHEKRFRGESTIPYLRPGYRFDLDRHYRDSFNQPYLTIELTHEGSQTGYLVSGIRETLSETEKRPYYRNNFVTIPGNIQYRHPKTTPKPHFHGTINARIDAEGSGEYAQLDDQGRYKVVLPFDLSGRRDGKASHWMRMAQPYAGENQGMHFPLHKHTEVLLTFIEGDPDRPIIASAIPNPESPSPVSSANQTKSIIQTGKGPETSSVGAATKTQGSKNNNYIEFEDTNGSNHIKIHSPYKVETFAGGKYKRRELGPSEESGHDKYEIDGTKITTAEADSRTDGLVETIQTFAPTNVYGYDEQAELTASNDSPPSGFPEEYHVVPVPDSPQEFTDFYNNLPRIWCFTDGTANDYDYYKLSDLYGSVEDAWKEYWGYWVYREHSGAKGYDGTGYINHTPSRPINSPWFIANDWDLEGSKTGHISDHRTESDWESHCQTKWDEWVDKKRKNYKKWQPHVLRGHVQVSHRDTFNMQEGNIYDFGGYWNYNLGNCYVEEHLDQAAELNKTSTHDLLDDGGPYWTEVDWSKGVNSSVSKPISGTDIEIGAAADWKKPTGGGSTNVWVNKQFGRSYTYSEVDSIEVTKGSSLNIQHGGKHIDVVFRGSGAIKSWSWQKGAHKKQKKWSSAGKLTYEMEYNKGITTENKWNYFFKTDKEKEKGAYDLPKLSESITDNYAGTKSVHSYCRDTGNLISYSSNHQGFNSKHSFNFNWANTASAGFTFAAAASFQYTAAAKISLAINNAATVGIAINNSYIPGANVNISTFQGGKLDLSLCASLFLKMQFGTAFGIDLDLLEGGKFVLDESKKLKFKVSGFEAVKQAAVKAEKAEIRLKKIEADILTNELRMQMGFELCGL